MANEQNLRPFTSDQDREAARRNGRKGREALTRKIHQAKSMSELAKEIAQNPASDRVQRKLSELGIESEDATNAAAAVAALYSALLKGNISAFDKWQQLTEAEQNDDKVFLLPAREIGKAFFDINIDIVPNMEYVFAGGRGSLKSSFVGFKIVELIKNHPDMSACVVRKVSNTMKDSVYAQVKWCILQLGLEDQFKFTTSPMEIQYRKTGQVIYFRGADDPAKLKSIKPTRGYIGILWMEEADQFSGEEEMRNIQQSVLRGQGDAFYLFKSFNPPKSRTNFMNRYIEAYKPNMVVHRSDYRTTRKDWLGEFFLNEAEHLKETNPVAYENEYLGIANGAGGLVFEDIEGRPITDEEISHFDRIYQGVDWGWYPDQYAFVRMYYDSARESLYIFDEHYVNKQSNEQTAQWIIDKGYNDFVLTCDSAEPKSVNDYIGMGLPARGAIKGPGSVDYGFKWLQRRHIIIDPIRCPNTYDEFTKYEYEKDKEGNDISGYPDGNDHAISAVRYAMESCMGRRENRA